MAAGFIGQVRDQPGGVFVLPLQLLITALENVAMGQLCPLGLAGLFRKQDQDDPGGIDLACQWSLCMYYR